MTKEDKIGAVLAGAFGGLCLVAYYRAPNETIDFLNGVTRFLGSINSSKKDRYSEAEDVEFEVVENPKEQTKEQLA